MTAPLLRFRFIPTWGCVQKSQCYLVKEEWILESPSPKQPQVPIFECRAAQFGHCFPSDFHVSYRLVGLFQVQILIIFSSTFCLANKVRSGLLPQHSPEQLSLLATQASVTSAKCRRMFAFSGEGCLRSLGVPRDLIGILNVRSHSRKEGSVRSNMKDKCSGLPLPVYSI